MATRAHLTGADEIYVGTGFLSGANPEERRGIRITPSRYVNFGAVAAALAEGIIKDATSTQLPDTETVTYTAATDGTDPQDATTRPTQTTITVSGTTYTVLEVGAVNLGRNLVTVVTHSSSVVAMTVKHYGFDIYKRAMTETHAITATGTTKTVTGAKAFRYWWKTEITAAGDAEANTLDLGTGVILGLPYRIAGKNALIARMDGVTETTATVVIGDATAATSSTGDVRGTISFAAAPNGTADYGVIIYVPDTSTAAAIYGVTQA